MNLPDLDFTTELITELTVYPIVATMIIPIKASATVGVEVTGFKSFTN